MTELQRQREYIGLSPEELAMDIAHYSNQFKQNPYVDYNNKIPEIYEAIRMKEKNVKSADLCVLLNGDYRGLAIALSCTLEKAEEIINEYASKNK